MTQQRIRITITLSLIISIVLVPYSVKAQTSTAQASTAEPISAAARTSMPLVLPLNDWSRLSAVELDHKLSVKLRNGNKVEGKLRSVSDTGLTLTVKNKPTDIKREDVESVHLVQKKGATQATLIGLGVGAGVGAAAGALGRSNDDGQFDFDKLDNAIHAGMIVLAAGAGAITGYFIGRSQKKRVLIYQATQP